MLDAGHIAVGSKLADQDQLKEVQRKRGRQYDEEDFKQLETLMYDRLSLQLEAAQVSLSFALAGSSDNLAAHGSDGGRLYVCHRES